jgi:hypothetical protein
MRATTKASGQKIPEKDMAELVQLQVHVPGELKQLVLDAADGNDESLAKFVTRALSVAVGRPEIAQLRRRRPGRPSNPVEVAR